MKMYNLEFILDQWIEEAKVSTPILYDIEKDNTLIIYTTQPGIMIGRGGKTVNKYLDLLKELHYPKIEHIRFVECTRFRIPKNKDTTIHEKAKSYKFTRYDYDEDLNPIREHVFYVKSQYLEDLYNKVYAGKYNCFEHFLNDKDPKISEFIYVNAFDNNAIINESIE